MKLLKSVPFQIAIAVALGILAGFAFDSGSLKPLSEIGKMIIHWVKIVAGPFLFLTIVHSVIEVRIRWRHGLKLLSIAVVNMFIAIAIGITLAKTFLFDIDRSALPSNFTAQPTSLPTLSFGSWIKTLMPKSLFEPFIANEILLIALLALVVGLAIRRVYIEQGDSKVSKVVEGIDRLRAIVATILTWLIHIIPFAVFAVIAGSVSEYGLDVFASLTKYVATVWLGFLLQATLVYGFWVFIVAKIKPKIFAREAKEPVLYALGVNSSLATLPLTMRALDRLGISRRSSSLGAGVATNINNDGIILYEALAVFFVAHLHGIDMDLGLMLT
ncbi:MAG: cation:dicarboxylase symporter family transporter, partial [Bdellovibrionota bacterium]